MRNIARTAQGGDLFLRYRKCDIGSAKSHPYKNRSAFTMLNGSNQPAGKLGQENVGQENVGQENVGQRELNGQCKVEISIDYRGWYLVSAFLFSVPSNDIHIAGLK